MKKIITILVIIMIILGAYYLFFNNQKESTDNQQIDTQTTLKNPDASSTEVTNNQPAQPSSVVINIKNFSFNPTPLTIKVGTKVTWINNDGAPHTITSDTGDLLNSPVLNSGQSFSFIFTTPGITNYHCNIHPMMKGAISVTQ